MNLTDASYLLNCAKLLNAQPHANPITAFSVFRRSTNKLIEMTATIYKELPEKYEHLLIHERASITVDFLKYMSSLTQKSPSEIILRENANKIISFIFHKSARPEQEIAESIALYFLPYAFEHREIHFILKAIKILKISNEIKDCMIANSKWINKCLSELVTNNQEAEFTTLFEYIKSCDLKGYRHFYPSSLMKRNPFLSNQRHREKLQGQEAHIEFKRNQGVIKVKLAYRDQVYSLRITHAICYVEDLEKQKDEIIARSKQYIDSCRHNLWDTKVEKIRITFYWKASLEQLNDLLQKGEFDRFKDQFCKKCYKKQLISLIINRFNIPAEKLYGYYQFLLKENERIEKQQIAALFHKLKVDYKEVCESFLLLGLKDWNFKWIHEAFKGHPSLLTLNQSKERAADNDLFFKALDKREWSVALYLLENGWNPLKAADGMEELKKILIRITYSLDFDQGLLGQKQNPRWKLFESILPLLQKILPKPSVPMDLSSYSQYTLTDSEVVYQNERKVYELLLEHYPSIEMDTWLNRLNSLQRHPDLLLFFLGRYPQAIQSIEVEKALNEYFENGHWNCAEKILNLGCPFREIRAYWVGSTETVHPIKSLLKCAANNNISGDFQVRFIELFKMLLKRGDFDLNAPHQVVLRGEINLNILENVYLNSLSEPTFLMNVALIAFENGASLTSRLLARMKMDLKCCPHPPLIEYLKKEGKIENWELAGLGKRSDHSTLPADDWLNKIVNAIQWLEEQLKLNSLSSQLIPIKNLREIRVLKKKVKEILSENTQEEWSIIQQAFHKMSALYDQLVSNHLLLKELREISKELRGMSEKDRQSIGLNARIVRLFSLWGDFSFDYQNAAHQCYSALTKERRAHFWNALIDKILSTYEDYQHISHLIDRPIVWVHGTKFGCLPLIKRVGGLLPAGEIFEKGFAPGSGELCGSDKQYNATQISGEILTTRWAENFSALFEASSRFLISYLYAMKTEGYGDDNEKYFNPQKAWERLSLSVLEPIIKKGYVGQESKSAVLRTDIIRLRMTDTEANEKLSGLKEWLEKQTGFAHDMLIQDLYTAITRPLLYQLTPEETAFMMRREPVIFASVSIDTTPLKDNREYFATGFQQLGKDLQFAFTHKENVTELQKELGPFGIHVFPYEIALLLETMQMIKGSKDAQLEKTHSLDIRIAETLQRDIFPVYAEPFPPKPSYTDPSTLQKVVLTSPLLARGCTNYEEYMDKIKKGLILARGVHGPLHSARVTLWTQILLAIYQETMPEKISEYDPYYLAITGACHDIARQDEGIDRWERESSQFLKSYLQARGLSLENIRPYVQAIKEKDPAKRAFSTVIQMIVHDSDCLEMMRVLNDFNDFKQNELCFYAFAQIDQLRKENLIKECHLFIQNTEAIKADLEKNTDNLYLALIKHLLDHSDLYPTLNKEYKIRL